MTQHSGLPVQGYRPQSGEAVALVNLNKQLEEQVLRALDLLAANPEIDVRWLAIGRTSIEQGFMAVNRAVFKPARLGQG
ncbi:MAG: cyclic nucleotide-binding protein [Methylobacterium sp.]|nr:cyclic nucleotide-binding protein [Methylobacterium sp.]